MGSASQLQTLIARITSPDLSRDRHADFQQLRLLVDECVEAAQPLDLAHQLLTKLYVDYAKRVESAAAFRQFATFSLLLSRSLSSLPSIRNRKFAQRHTASTQNPFTLFLIDTDAWLGHLQILGSFLQLCTNQQKAQIEVIAFSGKQGSKFSRLLHQLGINYGHIPKGPIEQRLEALEQHISNLNQRGWSVRLVWITWPPLLFVGGLRRLAPTQIAWAMKYPFQLGLHYDETIYAYGFNKKADQKIFLHDSFIPVRLLPFSLTTEILQASDQAIPKEISEHAVYLIQRWKQVPGHTAILSVARPEKMTNSVFLEHLARLLLGNPESHFFWCGRKGSADVDRFQQRLEQYGIQSRSSLLGWVQPWPVIKACDYFLDTYPFGSGITMAQALRHGKPIITYVATSQRDDSLEKTLVEEPNFNQLLTEDGYSNILLLGRDAPPRLQSFTTTEPEHHRNTDPFAPNPAVHQLLSQRLLGSRAGEQP